MLEYFILCEYSEGENKEIKLVKVGEFSSDKEAKEEALKLQKGGARLVLLTELRLPIDSRAIS